MVAFLLDQRTFFIVGLFVGLYLAWKNKEKMYHSGIEKACRAVMVVSLAIVLVVIVLDSKNHKFSDALIIAIIYLIAAGAAGLSTGVIVIHSALVHFFPRKEPEPEPEAKPESPTPPHAPISAEEQLQAILKKNRESTK